MDFAKHIMAWNFNWVEREERRSGERKSVTGIHGFLRINKVKGPLVARVMCLALPLLWSGFNPWPGNFLNAMGIAKKKKNHKSINSKSCWTGSTRGSELGRVEEHLRKGQKVSWEGWRST